MKKIILGALANLLLFSFLQAQNLGWHYADPFKDSVYGISINKAYDLLEGKKSVPVQVAVIDNGVDTAHEDLTGIIWNNPDVKKKEKKNKNHYQADFHGWNFIGGKKGNVQYDNLESIRMYKDQKNFYDSLSDEIVPQKYLAGYRNYMLLRYDYYKQLEEAEQGIAAIGQDTQTYAEAYRYCKYRLNYQLNVNYDPRQIVGDNYVNTTQAFYGNNDVTGPDAKHGTHVAGIIAATRGNGIGMNGIADNVSIMCVRAVPDGDERDKDVANAIRYAVDHGAKVINMSFGKAFSSNKNVVDDAVKYAMTMDVLLIHASGNSYGYGGFYDLDQSWFTNFPNRHYADSSGDAKAWIEVGASTESGGKASFSNYGKKSVDVFAPGVHIYSTVPGNKYESLDGTSMAAPVVSGLAALIREYYPKLTAIQVKDIIMNSVIKRDVLKDKCVSGGIVNAYTALKLAATYK